MGGLTSPRASPQAAAVLPQYTGLQLSTATNTLPIPIVYGLAKIGVNVIYYNNFRATPVFQAQQKAGKGGLFGGGGGGGYTFQIVGYTYSADLMLALCEGPIAGIGQVFIGQGNWLFNGSALNPRSLPLPVWPQPTSVFTGTLTQTPWSYLGAGGPNPLATTALAYPGTAYIAAASFALGSSASIGTLTLEVGGRFYGTGQNGIDADPAQVIQDFLTNTQYGADFPAAELDAPFLVGASGDSSVQTYCKALGLSFSAVLNQPEPANGVLTRWLGLINCAAVRSGGKLRFIPYGDMDLTGVDATHWVAPVAPIYYLTEDHFINRPGEDRVKVSRVDPYTLPNVQRVEVLNRAGVNVTTAIITQEVSNNLAVLQQLANRGGGGALPQPQGQPQYQATPVEARDIASIQTTGGIRLGSTVTAHEICDLNVGSIVAQIILQRQLYVRAAYKFMLDWRFCLLDPMDVVAITDPLLGLSQTLVRITEIEENDDGALSITAEELVIGVSTPGPNLTSGVGGSPSNAGVATQPVDAVVIYEPPRAATNGNPQIWFGASGGAAGVADPNYGGSFVWVSSDGGTTYQKAGTIYGQTPLGVLTSPFASALGFDVTSTLAVSTAESAGVLSSTTDANAQQGLVNLALVKSSELVDFATATLTGSNAYNLTRIQRGVYGTTPGAAAIGDSFALLLNTLQLPLPATYVGKTIKVKFQAFNLYGGAVQDIATCAVFSYVIGGGGYNVSTQSQTLTALSGASVSTTITIPAKALLLSVQITVTTAVTGPTSINIDPQFLASGAAGGAAGLFGVNGVLLGATHTYSTPSTLWSVASAIVLTPVGGAFTGGAVQVTIQYITV